MVIRMVFFTEEQLFLRVTFIYHAGRLPKWLQRSVTVANGVNKKTTILVVGNQDVKKIAGHEKSLKHRKAEKLITEGYPIRILQENDFKELVFLSERK